MTAERPGGPGGTAGMLSLDDLKDEAESGAIDTVVAAFTDMQGRLFGKRIQVNYFLDEVTEHGIEGCDYLLALDMEMEPVPGYEMANWEKGYGDFGIAPDMATLRRIPWLDRTAMVLCDVVNHDGSPVVASPRQVLIAQYERAAEMGYTPFFASELEFYLYKESYAEAHEKDYRDLTPTIPYILDYHVLATTMDEAYLGPIRRGMQAAGIPVEFSKGEAWYGQHEVNTRYADAVTSADRHTIYKNGVKEIAFLNGISASFMAKPSEKDIGSSCHIHSSLFGEDGNSFVDGHDETDTFRHYLGGLRAHIRELSLFIAPSVNSYKRYAAESWAPTSVAWARDNRTAGVPHPRRRRESVPRLRRVAGRRARRHRKPARPGARAHRQRLRGRRGGTVSIEPEGGPPALGGQRVRQAGLRRGGAQALPELRTVRAEGLRARRHRLRASAHVRARLSSTP